MTTSKTAWMYIQKPRDHDILPGRGQGPRNHLGNALVREMVKEYAPTYKNALRKEKGEIAKHIVHRVKHELNPPGRFLEKAGTDGYKLLPYAKAVEKVKQAIRDSFIKPSARSNNHSKPSSMTGSDHSDDSMVSAYVSDTDSIVSSNRNEKDSLRHNNPNHCSATTPWNDVSDSSILTASNNVDSSSSNFENRQNHPYRYEMTPIVVPPPIKGSVGISVEESLSFIESQSESNKIRQEDWDILFTSLNDD